MKTIFNTYFLVESQEQANRLKQICIDNNLRIWDDEIGFVLLKDSLRYNVFCATENPIKFAVWNWSVYPKNAFESNETEWFQLLQDYNANLSKTIT